ncbi:TPA: hypothetical protein DCX16_00075 [bacterium]|nr:hypothetical protein [bacterium]
MKKGFTLNELLIVVVIIGILLAIVIPKLTEIIDRSRETATRGNLGNLKIATSMYYGHNEEWPRGDIAGDADGGNDANRLQGSDLYVALIPEYITGTIPTALLRRGIQGRESNIIYTNEMHPDFPAQEYTIQTLWEAEHKGGWFYHAGSHTFWINSTERDTVGVYYSDYE